MSDTLKQIADNLGVTTINGNYLSGIADYYGVNLTTSKDLMADILTAVGGDPATSTDYLKDIVLALGGTVTINANWMEAWEAITAIPTSPPVNVVEPAVSGTTTLGSVLTTTNGTWTNSPSSFAYVWKRNSIAIGGATSSTYTLVFADSGASITSEVTATNAAGSTAMDSGNAEIADNFTPVNAVAPVISGSSTLGSVLTTTNGTWTNSPTFAYQWRRGASNIVSATASTYTIVSADSGNTITCRVTATNPVGTANSTSNGILVDIFVPVNTVAPVISGSTALGSVITTTNGTWSNSPSSFAYQWKRGATNIGTNTTTYTLVAADSAANITCVVTATNALGSGAATSNIIVAQTYSAPVNTIAPVISGSTLLGSLLTTTDGTWSGNPAPTFAYVWNRNGSPIASATASTYTLVSADSAAAITCVVTATNALGTANATSNTLTIPTYSVDFVSTWATTTLSETVTLPYEVAGTYSGTIDWGDSNTSTNSYADRAHVYATAGTYTISISGVATGFRFGNAGDKTKIKTIVSWGILRLGNNNGYFQGCTNLTMTAVTDTLDLTGTTNFQNIFSSNTALTSVNNINSWSTGSVTTMRNMFQSCTNFNQALSFSTTSVTTMQQMFISCTNFNSAVTFSTASVTNMTTMFFGCTNFNSAITFTSTAAVTNMSLMFNSCTNFNQALNFNTGAVTNMGYMFTSAPAFQQNIGAWNVALVTDFSDFMSTKTPATFSTTNLDAIYNGWVAVQSSRTITFGTAKYSAAGTAGRTYLTGTKLWTITDGGL